VSLPPSDPARPTTAPPGSAEKIAVLTARAELRLGLFVPGDVEGARERQAPHVHAFQVPLHCQRERLLLDHLNGHVRAARELATALALPLGRVQVALALLKEAGVVTWSRKGGWRLAEL
jgi:hypothetical protein